MPTDPEFDAALVDQVAEALYARDREPDHMDPEYDWANIDTGYDWSDEDQSPTDDYREAARIALGAVTSVLGIDLGRVSAGMSAELEGGQR